MRHGLQALPSAPASFMPAKPTEGSRTECERVTTRAWTRPPLPPAPALGHGTIIPTNATLIVERTQYFAKPGLAAEVLDVRRKASAVRLSIGLPAGEIFVKHPGGDGSEPDVAWQCTFADVAARDADLAARAASAEFESVRVQMRKLYARFERQVFAIASL